MRQEGRVLVRDPKILLLDEPFEGLAPLIVHELVRICSELAGVDPHADVVVIRLPDRAALDGWFASAASQAPIPLREQAADVVLTACETQPWRAVRGATSTASLRGTRSCRARR